MTNAYLTTQTLLKSIFLLKTKTTNKFKFGIVVLEMHDVFYKKRKNERSKRCYKYSYLEFSKFSTNIS